MPSENEDLTTAGAAAGASAGASARDGRVGDRRTRKRAARRDHLLDLAADLVEADGVAGVTMTALAERADYAPASLYTYFDSRSALLAALQQRALTTLARVASDHVATWDAALLSAEPSPPAPVAALARLWAFSDLFLAAPHEHPREFRLQQQLLTTPDAESSDDAADVVPVAMGVLSVPRSLIAAATDVGALDAHRRVDDPLGLPVDGALVRTLAWVSAMNGALLVDGLTTGMPSTGGSLGTQITAALLVGWGAAPDESDEARALSHDWDPPAPR